MSSTPQTRGKLTTHPAMPPRSTRAAPAKEAPESAPKRRASARVAGASNAALKKQKYDSSAPDKSVKSTTRKSKYFQKDEAKKPKRNAKRATKPQDDYEDEEPGDSSDADSDFWQPEQSSTAGKEEISQAVKDFENNRATKSDAPGSSEKKDLWREGVKTGLGPGREVFIEKPKARDPGDVPYEDNTLHPNTILFLKDLTKNNERQWLKGNHMHCCPAFHSLRSITDMNTAGSPRCGLSLFKKRLGHFC